MRIVLDTNILVSGIINPNSPPGLILRSERRKKVTLISSPVQIAELQRVLEYKHIQKFISSKEATKLLKTIGTIAVIIKMLPEVDLSPDPDDNAILATAVAGGADYIVSGDKRHILSLGSVEGIPLISARELLKL